MSRTVLQAFEDYQKARVSFVQTVADLATRPQNIDTLQNANVMALLRPLLLDNVASIQQSAALALGPFFFCTRFECTFIGFTPSRIGLTLRFLTLLHSFRV